ncbi:MAG: helix-turn-helix transcriptional regulator [Actinobacteria bacterium]|nr:helix-turn-helix transcriptional regulator [Actinomycetota bacterium]
MVIPIDNSKSPLFSKTLTGLALVSACVLAWVFTVFLSSALYQGNSLVLSATLFTNSASLSLVLSCALILIPFELKTLIRKSKVLLMGGLVFLTLGSFLACMEFFTGLHGYVAPMILGFLVGVGLSFVILSLIFCLVRYSFRQVVVWLLISLSFGIVLFLIYMAVVPINLMPKLLSVFPLVAVGVLFASHGIKTEQHSIFSSYIRSIKDSQTKGMFEQKAFVAYVFISGFLFGYCYNIYPKTTRFAGAYTDILFGLVSPAAVIFLFACFTMIVLLVLIGKLAGRNSIYVFGGLLVVALAVLYFNLPNMSYSGFIFVLLDIAAASAVLFVLAGAIAQCSQGDKKGFMRCILLLMTSTLIGVSLATVFIETTISDSAIYLPDYIRDGIIIGIPAIGFIALALVFFVLSRTVFFPAPLDGRGDVLGLSDLARASKILTKRFSLTAREEEIIEMLLQGRSGPYISENFYLSKSTVKTHIRHIYDKTGVSSRQQLIDLAHSVTVDESAHV